MTLAWSIVVVRYRSHGVVRYHHIVQIVVILDRGKGNPHSAPPVMGESTPVLLLRVGPTIGYQYVAQVFVHLILDIIGSLRSPSE